MHELSIATSVVETLNEALVGEEGEVVLVRLRVGALSGVVPDALHFAWDVACRDTRLSNSKLMIEDVQAKIWCDSCGCEQEAAGAGRLCCPKCGAPAAHVVTGYELEVHSVEVSQDE